MFHSEVFIDWHWHKGLIRKLLNDYRDEINTTQDEKNKKLEIYPSLYFPRYFLKHDRNQTRQFSLGCIIRNILKSLKALTTIDSSHFHLFCKL